MLEAGETAVEDERSFLLDVLKLVEDETEEQMDEKLNSKAKELGVDVDVFSIPAPKPVSTRTFSSEAPRRSESIDSRASQSTGLTSNFSGTSKGTQTSRASLSFRDYDNFLARGRLDGRQSISFSPPTTPSHSGFSLPLSSPSSSPKKPFRRIRGLSILRLHRTDSGFSNAEGCPHCRRDMLSQRRAVHRLPCGHRLCTQALRDTVRVGTMSKTGAVPSCCGVPIPGALVEHVMSQEEQSALFEKLEQWNEAAAIALSTTGEIREAGPVKRPDMGSRSVSNESKVDSVDPHARTDLDKEKLQDVSDFRHLQREQTEMLERFSAWIEKQRLELKTKHGQLRAEMKSHHERATEDLHQHHENAMVEAEDKQVKAEADLREIHTQEKRDNATALKHMEAYCAGTYSTGELHNRLVTDQDRAELDKTRRVRDTMDGKHTSAINILRGEQGRRMKLRAQRQENELQERRRTQRKEELEFERACTSEVHKFDEDVTEKRGKIRVRCEIQNAILTKRIANDSSLEVKETFSNVDWRESGQIEPHQAVTGATKAHEDAALSSGISTGIAVSGQG